MYTLFRYKVMAKERQINPFGKGFVSSETCLDQLNKAPAERTIVGMNKKDKIVVSDDRVLFLKHKRDGIMNEWVEVFTKDVKALEINTPGQCKLFPKRMLHQIFYHLALTLIFLKLFFRANLVRRHVVFSSMGSLWFSSPNFRCSTLRVCFLLLACLEFRWMNFKKKWKTEKRKRKKALI